MNKKIIKIIGIMLCMLVSAQITPLVIGIQTNSTMNTIANPNFNQDPQSELFGHHIERAMIMGHISHIHKIGRIVFAHAEKIHYFGMDDHKMNMGILKNREIIFRENPRLHMMHIHGDVFTFGHVREIIVI